MGTWTPGTGPTTGNDIFTGDGSGENVNAGPGNDTLNGNGGNDNLNGHEGDDTLDGGDGNDILDGYTGSNTLYGRAGDDSLMVGDMYRHAESGLNRLYGGAGNDSLLARALGPLGAELYGEDGDDILSSAIPNGNILNGGAGYDTAGAEGVVWWDQNTIVYYDLVINLATQTMTGNGETDTLVSIEAVWSGAGNDTITGDAGFNWLIGDRGNDLFIATGGNDIIIGGWIYGRPSAEPTGYALVNGNYFDTVSYINMTAGVQVSLDYYAPEQGRGVSNLGVDRLNLIDGVIGSEFNDTIVGSVDPFADSRDTIGYDNPYGDNHLEGRGGDDYLVGVSGRDFLESGAGTDFLDGGTEDDRLSGGDGDDIAYGREGNDSLFGGEGGTNTLDGGSGDDVISFEWMTTAVVFDFGAGGQLNPAGADTLISIEGVAGGAGADRLTGDIRNNRMIGNGGADQIMGLGGDDTIDGGAGNDVLSGGDGFDFLAGGEGDDSLSGGAGDDILNAGLGTNVVDGGDGFDTLLFTGIAEDIEFNLVTGSIIGAGQYTLVSIEAIEGGEGDDLFTGNSLNNNLRGGAGDDRLLGGGGNDSLGGGDGEDILFGGDGDDFIDGGWNFDRIDGGAGNDMIITDGDYSVSGGDGDDHVRVTGAISFTDLQGGSGQDTLEVVGLTLSTQVTFAGFEILVAAGAQMTAQQIQQFQTVRGGAPSYQPDLILTGSFAEVVSLDLSAALGNESIWITAPGWLLRATIRVGGGDDIVQGTGGADELYGGNGDDILDGNSGADRLDGGADMDTATYANAGETGITVRLDLGTVVDPWGGVDQLISIETVIGTAYADTLVGDAAANSLIGGAGADIISGGAGSDILDGGAGIDVLAATYDPAGVTVHLAGGWMQDHTGAFDTVMNFENVAGSIFNDTLVGNAGANTLWGAAGDDWIVGEGGDDLLEGGTGVNVLIGGDGTDLASYAAQTTNLWIDMAAGVYSATGVWDVFFQSIEGVLGGSGNDSIFGNASDNTLRGGIGDDALIGGGGADRLQGEAGSDWIVGGDGNDRLIGGEGVDVLTGGAGADIFDLGTAAGWDVAFDFSTAEDRFSLGGLQWLGFLTIDADGDGQTDDTLLGYAGGNFVALNVSGLSLAQWNALVDGTASLADAEKSVNDLEPDVLPGVAESILGGHAFARDFVLDDGNRLVRGGQPETPFVLSPPDDWAVAA